MHGQERGHVKNRGFAALLSIIHRIKNVIISWLYNKKRDEAGTLRAFIPFSISVI
jgi:hypothetical protein